MNQDSRIHNPGPRRRSFEGADTPEGGASRKTALIQILALPVAVVTAAVLIATIAVIKIGWS